MFIRSVAVLALVAVPAVAAAQRSRGSFGGEKEADWKAIGGDKAGGSGIQLSNGDVEKISPVRLLVDKRKDLKLTDDQLKRIKDLEEQLKGKNQPAFRALDSLRKESKASAKPSDEDRSRMMGARRGVMTVLGDIRANYEASLKEALALLDESQQKTANELVQKQSQEAEEMLKDKLGGRGGPSGAEGGEERRGRPPVGA
jgi:hypothetical protein